MTELGVFAKYWLPGAVKTRLAPQIGLTAAAELQRAFVETTLRRLAPLADRRTLVYSPDGRGEDFAALAASLPGGTTWHCEPQGGGDLGCRMAAYLARARARADRVVLLGSDSPHVPRDYVERAFDLLAARPVVFGPADDGGYYLVGASGGVPPIFSGIDWSTPRVWPQTIERLAAAGVEFGTLPSWYDVDEPADLQRLRDDLPALAEDDPDLARLRRQVESIALAGRP